MDSPSRREDGSRRASRGRLRPSGGKGGGIVTASAELAAARIMAVWLPRLAIDRWRRLQGCAKGEGADASPLVLIAETAHGPRIEAANDAGLEAGARPGMRLADARTLCPALRVAPADPEGDRTLLGRLAEWAQHWGPWAAVDPPDALTVDVRAFSLLFAGEPVLLGGPDTNFTATGF